jgi:hypothetical protein
MPLKTKKQAKESTQGLIRRFSRKMRKSGILIEARKKRFVKREKSTQLKKRAALRKNELKEKYEKLKKWGRL